MWPFRKKALTGTPAVIDALSEPDMDPVAAVGRREPSAHP